MATLAKGVGGLAAAIAAFKVIDVFSSAAETSDLGAKFKEYASVDELKAEITKLEAAAGQAKDIEDGMFSALRKAAAAGPMAEAWAPVLQKMQAGGTASGAQAAATAEQVLVQAQQALRAGRHASMRAAQALAEGYAAMVSGVLVGMSEALKQPGAGTGTGSGTGAGSGGRSGKA
jgi:hypothetical protein